MQSLKSQPVALITGASRGIGRETALKLAKKGYSVVITSRKTEHLEDISRQHPSIHLFESSLSSSDDFQTIHDFALKTFGKVDILINNAGTLINKPFTETTDEDWQNQLNCNLLAPIRLIRALHPLLNSGGHIINIGSMGGFQGSSKFPGLTAYSVSKGGLSILSECLANEFSGVSVNCLCLGAVQTEMLAQAFPGFDAPVNPTEMADFIADFAINGQKYFNGKVLPVSLADPK
jgi:3-oxoacyl-[acyl-carrier protein] reductase